MIKMILFYTGGVIFLQDTAEALGIKGLWVAPDSDRMPALSTLLSSL